MADTKTADAFGLDGRAVASLDWKVALQRVAHDLRSDFIYAPHFAIIYNRAGGELVSQVKSELSAGAFNPGLPISMEVPKSFRMRIAVTPARLGPPYSRPGSILLPKDRLLYQALADAAAPVVEQKTDKERSFSHQLAPDDTAAMFLPTRVCWNGLQKALAKHAKNKAFRYVLKIDAANYFGSMNQHILINSLRDAGYNTTFSSRLETMMVKYTEGRSSRGILQGMYPSDLLGNFYLNPIDRFLDEEGVASARYVDDLYIFVSSVARAESLMQLLIPQLRAYDINLNEAKSAIFAKKSLNTEEPDLEALFSDAVEEISGQIEDEDFDVDYGFQSEWQEKEDEEENEDDEEELELKATMILFDSISEYQGQEENIERFCLPLFAKAQSDYAVDHVMQAFGERPSMAQIYCSYLTNFLSDEDVVGFLTELLEDDALLDWQKMWVLAALLRLSNAGETIVKPAWAIFKDTTRHEALRAVAAILVGRFGDHARRKALITAHNTVSEYIKLAIYFSARTWPKQEFNNVKASWSGLSPLHTLLTTAMTKK